MGKDDKNNENAAGSRTVGKDDAGHRIHLISIIGQIEGHYLLDSNQKSTKYEQIIPQLVSVEEDGDIDGLLIILNTMGGDVEAGLAIAELVSTMKKPTVSIVLGGSHSIGVPLAVCAGTSFIVPSATMTLHPVRTSGLVIGVPQTFYYFSKMQERILGFICSHSNADRDTLRKLMMNTDELANDVGTIIEGDRAVELGLIDALGGISDALAKLHEKIDSGKSGDGC